MARNKFLKRLAVTTLTAAMTLSTGAPAFAATANSVTVGSATTDAKTTNSTAGKIADVISSVDTTSTGKWGNDDEKKQYLHEHFAVALVDAGVFDDTNAAYSAITVTDSNTYKIKVNGTTYTVNQTDATGETTAYEDIAQKAEAEAAAKKAEQDALDKQVADALKTIDTKNLSKAEVADALSHAFGYTVKLTQNGVDVISNSDKFSENDVITATWNGKSGTATVTIHDAVDTVLQNAVDAIESKMLPENNSDISKDYPEITSQTTTTDLKNYAEAVLSDAGITGVAVKYVVKDGDKDIANGANLSGHFTLSYTKDNKEYTADAKYNLPTATCHPAN